MSKFETHNLRPRFELDASVRVKDCAGQLAAGKTGIIVAQYGLDSFGVRLDNDDERPVLFDGLELEAVQS